MGKWNQGRRINGVSLVWVWGKPLEVQKDDVECMGDWGGEWQLICQGRCLETLLRFAGVSSCAFGSENLNSRLGHVTLSR